MPAGADGGGVVTAAWTPARRPRRRDWRSRLWREPPSVRIARRSCSTRSIIRKRGGFRAGAGLLLLCAESAYVTIETESPGGFLLAGRSKELTSNSGVSCEFSKVTAASKFEIREFPISRQRQPLRKYRVRGSCPIREGYIQISGAGGIGFIARGVIVIHPHIEADLPFGNIFLQVVQDILYAELAPAIYAASCCYQKVGSRNRTPGPSAGDGRGTSKLAGETTRRTRRKNAHRNGAMCRDMGQIISRVFEEGGRLAFSHL